MTEFDRLPNGLSLKKTAKTIAFCSIGSRNCIVKEWGRSRNVIDLASGRLRDFPDRFPKQTRPLPEADTIASRTTPEET
ncbi:MAG: hypothetical protein EON51_18010 [Acinetobacter sp.]|nr:MAG: hypothetical protein EON51_18010 [Acinetobacter sp.]